VKAAIVPVKKEREANMTAAKDEAKAHLAATLGEEEFGQRGQEFSAAWKALEKKVMRARVISEGVRLDGRSAKEIRPLAAPVSLLPRAHGSAPFERGAPRGANAPTVGGVGMNQMIDPLDLEDPKRYMPHYNSPPFSTGETG